LAHSEVGLLESSVLYVFFFWGGGGHSKQQRDKSTVRPTDLPAKQGKRQQKNHTHTQKETNTQTNIRTYKQETPQWSGVFIENLTVQYLASKV